MKWVRTIILMLLTFLAVSSGIAKIVLMEQDVAFFGKFGFSNSILIAFGVIQLIGGALLPFAKTRFTWAAIVEVTFLVSLVLLLLDGNIPVSVVTAVAMLLLGFVIAQQYKQDRPGRLTPPP